MDISCIMAKDRLGFVGILREALRVCTASPRFLILAFLASFPLFCSLLLNELLLQQTFLNTAHFAVDGISECSNISGSPGVQICYFLGPISALKRWVGEVSRELVLMSALYLVIVNPLDLLNTIVFVHNASAIYGGENLPSLREFFIRPFKKIDFRGPLVTFMAISGVLFVALFAKYMEWSAIWNTGIVISILEGKHGDIALGVAAYLSRGSRRKGFALMLVFFIWRLALRLYCLYFVGHSEGSGFVATTAVQVYLVCLGNVVKWSVFMVHYCDCKKRFLEKKIDVEEGEAAPLVKS
ncbi:hypothetical protein BT93_J1925 [Corymbia citriodora subsp. variegata]|nr:hypothetical protein BT93_J1925 [Corymbia citriodora subsp. variegata]